MDVPKVQTAIVQSSGTRTSATTLPLTVSDTVAVPALLSDHHVLVRVLAVALNPTDYKNPIYFPTPGQGVGSDFCGIVVKCGASVEEQNRISPGVRVSGAIFPYSAGCSNSHGAFAEWVVADGRLVVRVPEHWDDLQGAALGGVGWGTVGLALSDPEALALEGLPSRPTKSQTPVLVYGGATATGTMACQLLRLSGYSPIAVVSAESAPLSAQYGAIGTAPYTSPNCAEEVRKLAADRPIREVIDCITSAESMEISFAAIARTGGRYACLEAIKDSWRTRRLVRVKEVMGYEALGLPARLGSTPSTYWRETNMDLYNLCQRWRTEVQMLLDTGSLRHHPVREVQASWKGIMDGLAILKAGGIRGHKLAVRVGSISHTTQI